MTERIIWNKGLTKDTDSRVKKISVSLTGRILSEEHRKKVIKNLTGWPKGKKRGSQSLIVRINRGKTLQNFYKSPEGKIIKNNISKKLKGRISPTKGTKMSLVSNLKRSETIKKLILNGYNPINNSKIAKRIEICSKKGGKIITRSKLEYQYINFLEQNDDIISFEYEKLRIPYLVNYKTKIAIIDFSVQDKINNFYIVEVKPRKLWNKYINNKEKIIGISKYCKNNNINLKLWDNGGYYNYE